MPSPSPPLRRAVAGALLAVLSAGAAGCGAASKLFRGAPRPSVPPAVAQERLAELWVDPGDPSRLDLYHGVGGEALMPRPGATFRFREKDTKGFSPGWKVVDERGVEWDVKLGPESQSEVVASRILWAMGYRQPPTYYLPHWTLTGGPEPGPGAPGRFRPRLPGVRRAGYWNWEKNPFADTQAFRGLLVLMRLINNWDLKDDNNALFELQPARQGVARHYVVIDLGASFGRTRLLRSGTRNDVEDYERQGFIEGVNRDGWVEFDQMGKWHRGLFKRLRPADVRWTCERLARLSEAQWQDAFRAAGHEPHLASRFIRKIQRSIADGLALREPRRAASPQPPGSAPRRPR